MSFRDEFVIDIVSHTTDPREVNSPDVFTIHASSSWFWEVSADVTINFDAQGNLVNPTIANQVSSSGSPDQNWNLTQQGNTPSYIGNTIAVTEFQKSGFTPIP